MTRETKIGLLVGLAFIIVIGILLSDYNRIEQTSAPLYGDQTNLKKGVGSPTGETQAHVVDTVVYPSAAVAPRQPVPTHDDLTAPPSGSDVVVISPFDTKAAPNEHDNVSGHHAIAPGGNEPTNLTPRGNSRQDIETAAHAHGMDIVTVQPEGNRSTNSTGSIVTASAGAKQYTAEPGDTVSKMAGRFMGGNTKANRDAIVAANPALQKNINNVIVGHVYVIPASSAAAPPSVAVQANVPAATTQKPQQAAPTTPVNQPSQTPTHWYIVKENDSLWKIAQEQLGDGNAVAAIKELNKDVLKGRDDIRPNMHLKLPAKPLASAN